MCTGLGVMGHDRGFGKQKAVSITLSIISGLAKYYLPGVCQVLLHGRRSGVTGLAPQGVENVIVMVNLTSAVRNRHVHAVFATTDCVLAEPTFFTTAASAARETLTTEPEYCY